METYYVSKKMYINAAHKLDLPYESKCTNFHGHEYVVTVHCKGHRLNNVGMIVDFAKIKQHIHGYLDHGNLNELLPNNMNPTAENMAKWICKKVTEYCDTGYCYRVDVQESQGNIATYECDEEEALN